MLAKAFQMNIGAMAAKSQKGQKAYTPALCEKWKMKYISVFDVKSHESLKEHTSREFEIPIVDVQRFNTLS